MRAAMAMPLTAALLALGAMAAGPADAPATMDAHVLLAIKHLSRLPRADREYVRFASWLAVPKARLATKQAATRWWLNQLSTSPHAVTPETVAGSHGLLWALDLRDYRWNAEAWRTVARREPYFREPWIPAEAARLLRIRIGEEAAEEKDGTVHVIGVVRADWLFRETLESARSPSYYDLLYAERRFGPKAKTDFPANETDWNEFFGIKDAVAFIEKSKIDPRRGAVVAGSRDDPVNGSIVARQNRVVQVLRSPWGAALKTFDAKETAGDTDYSEKHAEIAVAKIKFDAGELLASLPNGGQAGLLINGEGKRLEFATGEFVHPKGPDTRTPDVRTMMGCVICHCPDGGLIPPKDTLARLLKDSIDLKTKDRDLRNKTKAFFLDWESEVAGYQRPYYRLIEKTTAGPLGVTPPLKPAGLVKEFMAFRDWYDDPVTASQAAAELGVPVPMMRLAASKSVRSRAGDLARGLSVPREPFERDVFREVALILAAKETRR